MKQRLIVEGKDAVVLSVICSKHLTPPAGYTDPEIYKREFVEEAGSYKKALILFKASLKDTSISNLGLILDANQAGPAARWQALKNILAEVFPEEILNTTSLAPNGIVLQGENLPTVGIWLMPDNSSNGYLEHFLASLIPAEDEVWQHAKATVEAYSGMDFCKFTEVKKQKAMVHTWLAWQESPGLPFGTAASAGYFDVNAPIVQPFLAWFSRTFSLQTV